MIRLAVRCRPDQAEAVLAELVVLAPNGVEEERGPGFVEYAIYGGPGELPDLGGLVAGTGEDPIEVTSEEVPDDWADRWADFHKPIVIGDRVRIRPSWEQPKPDYLDVMVDPGQAFGTGAHPTTRMCVELLIELSRDGMDGPLADWGTGSAVLAISAAKLGFGPITACDREEPALEAAAANAEANGVRLSLERVDVREGPLPLAPVVTANLTAPLLQACAEGLARSGGDAPRALVCSGMLTREADDVARAFSDRCGLAEAERREDGDWASLRLELR